jgi:hypothetical protein
MLLKLGSVFPLDVSSSTWINILYKGYQSVAVILYLVLTASAPLYIFGRDYPLEEGIEVISIFMTQIRSGMNFVTFIIYKKEIQNLMITLNKNFYIHGRNLSAEESSVVREAIEHARKMTIGYVTLYSLTGLSMMLHPLTFKPTDLDQEDAFNHTEGPHRILPFKTWYPKWDTTKSPQYEIEYFAHATLTALEAWCVSSTDTFCVTLMIYVGCQFDLLGLALKNMNLKSGVGACKKRVNGSYPTQILTLNNNSTLPVISEENEAKARNDANYNDRLKASDESSLQDKGAQFRREEEYRTPSTAKSCKQAERETTMYIKECIKHHQSVLM